MIQSIDLLKADPVPVTTTQLFQDGEEEPTATASATSPRGQTNRPEDGSELMAALSDRPTTCTNDSPVRKRRKPAENYGQTSEERTWDTKTEQDGDTLLRISEDEADLKNCGAL